MVLPNPDLIQKNTSITLKKALRLFDTDLAIVNDPISKRQTDLMREAFIRAFLDLEEFDENEEIKKERLKSQEEKRQREYHKRKKREASIRKKQHKKSYIKLWIFFRFKQIFLFFFRAEIGEKA